MHINTHTHSCADMHAHTHMYMTIKTYLPADLLSEIAQVLTDATYIYYYMGALGVFLLVER